MRNRIASGNKDETVNDNYKLMQQTSIKGVQD